MNRQLSSSLSWRDGANIPSPVHKVLAFDYYDGPTYGVLQCGDGSTYRFDLLAWDQETQDLRVFSLSPLPRPGWDQLIALCSAHEAPRWPVWVLSWHEEAHEPVDDIRGQAGPVEWVVATEAFPDGEMLRVKSIRPEELNQVTDWGRFLELAQELPARGPSEKD
jgi:hypothetical protein